MRIRTIKPEFWRNRKLASLGREIHDFAARLITASDDEGFCEADPALLAGDLYPFDSDAQRFIRKSLPELERIGFIIIRGGEHGILCLPKFREHQRINRPSPSRLKPRFEQLVAIAQFSESSVSPHGVLSEPSHTEVEREREVEQGKGTGIATSLHPAPEDLQHAWNNEADKKLPRCRDLTEARKKHAKARLAEHGLPRMREVIAGISASDFCLGQNNRGWVADFDFLVKPDTPTRVLEGKYANRQQSAPSRDARDTPEVYEEGYVRMVAPWTNGYSRELIAIADEQEALGRPVPPVVSWLSGKPKDVPRADFSTRTAMWREQVAAWEAANPDAAIRWLELRDAYKAQEEIEEAKKYDSDEWNYKLLQRLGAPLRSIEVIQRKFDDKPSMQAANDWARVGTEWCLTLTGGPGCGKTTAATWAAHQLMMRGFRTHWVDCPSMVDAPMFGPEAELKKYRCREAGVLVLDDLGSTARERNLEKAPAPWMDWLDNVLAHRHGQRKKTIITSNRGVKWLVPWLGDRLADRLNEGTIHSTAEKSMRGQPQQTQREPGED